MADRRFARILAPLALVAAVLGVGVVIGTSGVSSTASKPQSSLTTASVNRRARHSKPRPRSYVVKPGDTLTAIASRTGVTIDAIEQLNPSVDPQTLRTGERLKLTR